MKIIKSVTKGNKKIVTLECHPEEQPRCFFPNGYYQLGYPTDSIQHAHELMDAAQVSWDSVGQEWIR